MRFVDIQCIVHGKVSEMIDDYNYIQKYCANWTFYLEAKSLLNGIGVVRQELSFQNLDKIC